MSIKDIGKKIKSYLEIKVNPLLFKIKDGFDVKKDTFIVLTIILVGLAGFGLGKLSALEKGREPIQIKKLNSLSSNINTSSPENTAVKLLVASKSGTKYHFPWCAGASQIADKNKIYFASYEEAQKAGYTPASNCQNLK
ncbi:MAG: hypothetical protein A2541_00300 [Candidatus Taylorbacteria bacterium RIFOXYD2_FULL_36_9]|uniref:Ada DNA repair metal-binding domain-containing protein n=1 Tax=Candidatus Taylorbacteria bacterium RIFOXYD2_FULL_36_9 TaxID=1802338 RepID=A0A1G2PFX4_9BACT|nr:MAG: hypothetical protein A2541_00300 [Candidatus Taylorbacteria bacterium RIFOXYD2_FULL_36_9]